MHASLNLSMHNICLSMYCTSFTMCSSLLYISFTIVEFFYRSVQIKGEKFTFLNVLVLNLRIRSLTEIKLPLKKLNFL